VTIVGGGLTGAAAALQLARARPDLAITVLEPREELGRGIAYTAPDPDHRLNAAPEGHTLDPDDSGDLRRWIAATGVLASDPEAVAANGVVFVRRHDYGRYIGERVREHPGIRHRRDAAIDVVPARASVTVRTAAGAALESELVVIATGNARPRLPAPLDRLAGHPAVIEDPSDLARIRAIASDARVLLVGGALTALDIASTLVRLGHRGHITVISRRGLRPRAHRNAPPSPDAPSVFQRTQGPLPAFVLAAGSPPSVRRLLRALRRRIAEVEAAGGEWQTAFDELRDVVWRLWPAIAPEDKRRFQHRLRQWYDVHRFRAPPQNLALVEAAERAGIVCYRTARIASAESIDGAIVVDGESYDAIVNCTGLDPAAGVAGNPVLAAMVERGLLTRDPSGLGFAVDAECRPIGAGGAAEARLRVLGPPTAGMFGDPLGAPFIVPQVRRALPGMLAMLASQGS
jgi:uncharacterized NAD(P)/FAD-binding protein YdhS